MSLNRPSKVFEIVAVSTNVPEMNATPSITAMPVSRKRTFLLRMPLTVTFHMAGLRAEALHLVEHRVGVGVGELVDDRTIGQEDDPVGVSGRDRVVGDHHDGLAEVVDRLAHEREDLGAGTGVEVAGGLVGEHDLGPAEQRTTDRHPLLLTTRELGRTVLEAVAEPNG